MKLVLILLLCLLAHELKGTRPTGFSLDKYIAAAPDVTRVHLDLQDTRIGEKQRLSDSHSLRPNAGHTLSWREGEINPHKNMPHDVKREKSYALVPNNVLLPDLKKRFSEVLVQRYRRRE
jgi:hypothetical protein